jgi:hypothetical protein
LVVEVVLVVVLLLGERVLAVIAAECKFKCKGNPDNGRGP